MSITSCQPSVGRLSVYRLFRDGTDITNAGSTGVTFITDPPDDSGSGQGNTICTQRTIARQTRIVDR